MADYTPHQKRIIKRYYNNISSIGLTKLAERTGEIYLAEGKKLDRLWKQVESDLAKLAVPQSRIDHILTKKDPALLAQLVKELT